VAEAVHQQEVVATTRLAALLHLSTHDGREDVNRQRKLTEKKAGRNSGSDRIGHNSQTKYSPWIRSHSAYYQNIFASSPTVTFL
jgi:hypothetical protein